MLIRAGRVSFVLCLMCAGVFLLDVLVGKASILFDFRAPFLLGDVGEFLLLLVAAGLFTIAILARERAAEAGGSD